MKEQQVNDALLRQFLLGRVDDKTRQQIESRYLTDQLFREKVLAVEDDLVEDYIEEGLTAGERERFVSQYADTAAQRRQLRIVKSIKRYAVANAAENLSGASTSPTPNVGVLPLRAKSIFLIPIAAILIIGVLVTAIWLNKRLERNKHHLAVEQQLARLNTPSGVGEGPPHTLLFVLPPVSVRSAGPQTELTLRTDTQIVELRLLWAQKEHYASHQAVLQRVGNAEQFTIRDLPLDNDHGRAIRLRLPAPFLTRGLYQISVSGINSDDSPGPTEEYTLSIDESD